MKSLAELRAIRERMAKQIDLRESGDDRIRVVVGMATCGIAAGARPVLNAFLEEVDKRQLKNVTVSQTGCIGVCRLEPIVEVYVPGQEKVTYVKMTPGQGGLGGQRASGKRPGGGRVHHRPRRNKGRRQSDEFDPFPYPGVHRHRLLLLQQPEDH